MFVQKRNRNHRLLAYNAFHIYKFDTCAKHRLFVWLSLKWCCSESCVFCDQFNQVFKFSKETHFATPMLLLDLIIEAEKLGLVDLSEIQQRKDGSLGCT